MWFTRIRTSGTRDKPAAITDKEAMSILRRVEEGVDKPKPKVLFEPGEVVRVTDGPFNDFSEVVRVTDGPFHPVEVVERAIGYPHHLAGLEQYLRLRFVHALFDAAQNRHRFLIGDGRRLV